MKDTREALHNSSAVALVTPDVDGAHAITGADLVLDDVLVEDVSIDGMCGVY